MAQEVENLLALYRAFITYVPLRTEVPFREYFTLPEGALIYEIKPRASLDPVEEARHAQALVGDTPTVIFIPGRAFDASGTRHGQGGGWYDRFLAEVPRTWLRVGVCFDEQFSPTPLTRESWDQEMDIVCVAKGMELLCFDMRKN